MQPVIHPIPAKENPRGIARVSIARPGCCAACKCCAADPGSKYWLAPLGPGSAAQLTGRCFTSPGERCTASGTNDLAADVTADDIAEQHPALALELHQLQLADRGEIGRRGVDLDTRQQDFGAEILQACGLLHDVFAGQVVAALF